MDYLILMALWVFGIMASFVHATSFGLMADGKIETFDSKPAICLPVNAKDEFPVGWISLSESYVRNPGFWAVSLKDGVKPLILKPGECVVFGEIPSGYELDSNVRSSSLKLEKNKTYVFRLSGAYKTRDTYSAVFCTGSNMKGGFEYHQYSRATDGGR
jgi:hypothetical protein